MNPIDEAADRLAFAKEHERIATMARLEAEQALIALMPAKTEGRVNMSGAQYKVVIEYGMNRTIDAPALEAIKGQVAPGLFEQAINYKPSLVLSGLRYLQSNEPDSYALLSQAITAKPAKPSVKVERIESEQQLAA